MTERVIEDEFDIEEPITQHPGMARRMKNNGNSLESRIERLDLPVLENEILFFRDTTHLYKFSEQFDELDDELTEELELDDLLDALESLYNGFYSFRTYLNDKYKIVDYDEEDEFDEFGMTDEEFLAFEEEDFIADLVYRALFNSNRLIGIGERVYYYHSINQSVNTRKNDYEAINILVDISNERIDDIFETEHNIFTYNRFNFDINEARIAFLKGNSDDLDSSDIFPKGSFIINGLKKYYSNPIIENSAGCNVYEKSLRVRVSLDTFNIAENSWENWPVLVNLNNKQNSVLSINWGDGSSLIITEYKGEKIFHTYPDDSTKYNITTTLTWDEPVSNLGNVQVTLFDGGYPPYSSNADHKVLEVSFSKPACPYRRELQAWRHTEEFHYRLRTKLWFGNIWYGRRIGSYSHCYRKNNKNKWKRVKADFIRTEVEGRLRNEECNYRYKKKKDEKERNNKKKVQKTKSWYISSGSMRVSNGDVKSKHRLEIGSVTLQRNMVLNPCP